MNVRFIMRDGKKILQQEVPVVKEKDLSYEWRDVPLIELEKNK